MADPADQDHAGAAIELRGVTMRYVQDAPPAVDQFDLRVPPGELLVLLGESGCGKTTTLKMINRLIEPTSGTILVGGRDIAEADPVGLRRSIGYVFQGVGLFPHLTVGENVGVVPHLMRWERGRTRARTDELLELVGLDPATFRDRDPDELSGGQRQRVGIARALAATPKTMLMDEPLGALDPITRATLQDELRRIHDQCGLTSVMVTHDMTEALMMGDRIGVMKAGRIVGLGTPAELLADPGDPYVERLLATPRREVRRLEALEQGGGAR